MIGARICSCSFFSRGNVRTSIWCECDVCFVQIEVLSAACQKVIQEGIFSLIRCVCRRRICRDSRLWTYIENGVIACRCGILRLIGCLRGDCCVDSCGSLVRIGHLVVCGSLVGGGYRRGGILSCSSRGVRSSSVADTRAGTCRCV